jgi:hypothetical protein
LKNGDYQKQILKKFISGEINSKTVFAINSGIVVPIRVYTRGACASATFSKHFGKQINDLANLDRKIADDQVLFQNVLNDTLGVAL